MFEATKDDVKSCRNVESVPVAGGFTMSANGMPLMLEIKALPVEIEKEERNGGIVPPEGFRMLETGTPLMLERNTSIVETEKEETKGGTGGFIRVEKLTPLMLEIKDAPVEI